jgi:hypothetical protein
VECSKLGTSGFEQTVLGDESLRSRLWINQDSHTPNARGIRFWSQLHPWYISRCCWIGAIVKGPNLIGCNRQWSSLVKFPKCGRPPIWTRSKLDFHTDHQPFCRKAGMRIG